MVDSSLRQLTFCKFAYTLVRRRNLQNRWRPPPPEERVLVVPLIDGRMVKDMLACGGLPGLPAEYVGNSDPDERVFAFDRVQYEAALASIESLPAIPVRKKAGLRF